MGLIKNMVSLATSDRRKIALEILTAGLKAIQPDEVLSESVGFTNGVLRIKSKKIRLDKFERVFLVGFGKGSAKISASLEGLLREKLTAGYVIDTVPGKFKKIHFSLGTHPLPSKTNIEFTEKVLSELKNLTTKDLVLIVVCGGGSALFEAPYALDLTTLTKVFALLLNSGANISEMNVVRKHLSKVKGGSFAKHLFPAKVVNLIFSDVPGNDLSVIASGPTVKSRTSIKKAVTILDKYKIQRSIVPLVALTELPTENKFFENVSEVMMLSNMIALQAMNEKAKGLGYKSIIFSDRVQGDARKLGKRLIEQTPPGKILLAGGESSIKVTGTGKGGRNQALVLASLPVPDDTLILSFDSDGLDFHHFGGAMGDRQTWEKSQKLKLDYQQFLGDDDSTTFFEKTGDGVLTGKLESNVADLIMVLRV